MTDLHTDNRAVRQLGAALRSRRLARGMSLRALAAQLHLNGHGTLVDYEHGRRIPPQDLVIAWERVLHVPDGALSRLRDQALAERANRQAAALLEVPDHKSGDMPAGRPMITPPRPRRRTWLMIGTVLGLVAGLSLPVTNLWSTGNASTR